MSQARGMQEVLEQQGEMLSPSLLLLEKSRMCFVLSARTKRGALAQLGWAVPPAWAVLLL